MSLVKLGEICDFFNGGAWTQSEFTETGYPVLKVSNCKNSGFEVDDVSFIPLEIAQKSENNKLYIGDVIIATVGSHPNLVESAAGRSCIVTQKVQGFYLNQNAVCLRSKDCDELDQRYLGYLAASAPFKHYIQSRGKGAANQMRIAIGAIKEYEFLLPEIKIQRKIGATLAAYDDLIENNQKQIKLLEEAAQRLYKEWFVDLRFPGHETTPITDGIPEGWKNVVVTDLLEIKYGKDHKALEDGNIPVYGSGGVMRKVNKILHSGESVLIPRKGSLNNILLVSGDFWTIDTMFFSIPRKPNVAKYVYLFLSGVDMHAMNIGAAVPSMTVKILDSMKVLCPSTEMLVQFEKVVGPYFSMIELLKKKNESLAETRDLLLPKLMNGEIEV